MSDYEDIANLNRRLTELTNYVDRELCPTLDEKFGDLNEEVEKLGLSLEAISLRLAELESKKGEEK